MFDCLIQLQKFFEIKIHNAWLSGNLMEVYVRKGRHYINNLLIETLDIANITVFSPGKGIGTAFIKSAQRFNPFPVTYIESILNTSFLNHLLRKGWLPVKGANPPCVYMTAPYILLEGLEHNNRFFSPYILEKDPTKLQNGQTAYKILGYAYSVEEARMKLYGEQQTHNDWGTKELEKLSEKIKNMSVEEYGRLFKKAQQDI